MYTIGIAYCDNKNTEVIPQTKNLVKGMFQTKGHITNIKYQENGQWLSSLLYGLALTCIEQKNTYHSHYLSRKLSMFKLLTI